MFFNDTATTEIYTLPLHDALTILGERALPLAWRVKKTHGAIGFREQRAALATVAALLPEGVRPTLMGDRFYGSRSEEHTSELQSRQYLVCRLLLEKKKSPYT